MNFLGQAGTVHQKYKNGNWIFKKRPTRFTKDFVDELPEVDPP